MLCDDLNGKEIQKRGDIYIHIYVYMYTPIVVVEAETPILWPPDVKS